MRIIKSFLFKIGMMEIEPKFKILDEKKGIMVCRLDYKWKRIWRW